MSLSRKPTLGAYNRLGLDLPFSAMETSWHIDNLDLARLLLYYLGMNNKGNDQTVQFALANLPFYSYI